MRIGFDAKRLFLNDRGLGNYSRNLLGSLVKYHPEQNYFLYTPKYSDKFLIQDLKPSKQIQVRIPSGLFNLFKSLWRSMALGSASHKDQLDVFHGLSHEIPADYKKSGAKVVVTIHDLIFVKHPEFYKPIDRWLYYKKVRFAVNHADKIVAISQQTKRDIIDEFNIDAKRIDVIYQSCNEVFYNKRTDEELSLVKDLGRLPDQYLLYVGALNENKNVMLILKAMAIQKKQPMLPLVIVGKGAAYRDKLEEFANRNNLQDRLHFINDFFDPTPIQLSCIYQMATMFIFPSFYEGFGIPILEARFSDIPVIASNSTCLEEAGGESSYYIDPEDANQLTQYIEQLSSGVLTPKLSRPNIFRADVLSDQMLNLYTNLI